MNEGNITGHTIPPENKAKITRNGLLLESIPKNALYDNPTLGTDFLSA